MIIVPSAVSEDLPVARLSGELGARVSYMHPTTHTHVAPGGAKGLLWLVGWA